MLRIVSDGRTILVKYAGGKAQMVVTQEAGREVTVPEVALEVFMTGRGVWVTVEGKGVHRTLEFGVLAMEQAALSAGVQNDRQGKGGQDGV